MPARPAAHVGLLHRPGQAPRGTAPAQRRPQPGPGANMHGRGIHARLPAGHRDTAMRNVVVTGCPRAGLSEVGALTAFGAATVHEAIGRTGYLGPGIRPVHLGSRIVGTAVTAVCWPGDNLMIRGLVTTGGVRDVAGRRRARGQPELPGSTPVTKGSRRGASPR